MIGFSASDSQSVNSQRQNCVTQCSSHRVTLRATLKLLLAALLISGLWPETNLLSQHQCQAADHHCHRRIGRDYYLSCEGKVFLERLVKMAEP